MADMEGCAQSNVTIIHACKIPCHRKVLSYEGSLPKTHPHYLSYTIDNDLYLNLIDPPVPLFKKESFDIFLDFATRAYQNGREIVIHCNQGKSRAPSLVLLLGAKTLGLLPNESYQETREAFESLYVEYKPGGGIEKWLTEHWNDF